MTHALTVTFALMLCAASLPAQAPADDNVLQQALNYALTGKIDPDIGPTVVDRKSCIIVMPDPKFKRYIRYYLSRFKMDAASINKIYSGTQPHYVLDVEGDDIIVEYLELDKTTVVQGFKSAHISLPGNFDQTQKALRIIFAEQCRKDKEKGPF